MECFATIVPQVCVQFLKARAKLSPPKTIEANGGGKGGKASDGDAKNGAASGGSGGCCAALCDSIFGPFKVLFSTPLLRSLTAHTLLINVLVAGVWCV